MHLPGCTCRDALRNAFFGSALFLHQPQYTGDNNAGRNSAEHRAHYCRLDTGNIQKQRRKQHISEDFKACRNKGHQHSRPPDFFKVG